MVESLQHPTNDKLAAFGSGRLPPGEARAVDSHVGWCDKCCKTLLSLSDDDTFVDLLHDVGNVPLTNPAPHDRSGANQVESFPASLANHARYEILQRIGTGGMGDVYKARHRVMNRFVALKVINERLSRRPEAFARFRREVHAAAQLSHPNIVAAHDAEQADDLHFLVMEYVDGVNLAELVTADGPLPIDQACEHIRQSAMGLRYAHQRGMIHRDIKPHNLMRDGTDTTKLLDFGMAMLSALPTEQVKNATVNAADLTMAGDIIGTPDYISPEQVSNSHIVDIRSDIYSLGATFYFLLSGQPPFPGGTVEDKLQQHLKSEPDSIESLRPELPGELTAIVRRMMTKNPAERFQTPAAVAKALEAVTSRSNKRPATTALGNGYLGNGYRRGRRTMIGLLFTAVSFMAGTAYLGTVYVGTNKATPFVKSNDDDTTIVLDTTDSHDPQTPEEVELAGITAINELGGRMRFDKSDPALVTVRFDGQRYNDSHLIHVERLEHIQTLYLPGTRVTDAGLRDHVSKMETLVNLYLTDTNVTDAGLRQLVGLKKLRVLYANDLPITDGGIAHIRNLDRLSGLSLDQTQITDDGLTQHIAQMTSLNMLFLQGTGITDAGLSSLRDLKNLVHLDVRDTAVSDKAIALLELAIPDCEVVR